MNIKETCVELMEYYDDEICKHLEQIAHLQEKLDFAAEELRRLDKLSNRLECEQANADHFASMAAQREGADRAGSIKKMLIAQTKVRKLTQTMYEDNK